jgi:hypothetical protein
MNDEGTRIGQGNIVSRSQPNLKIGERAIPTKNLNEDSKGETREMKNPYGLIFDSPKSPEKKEDDPKKMGQDNGVCKHFIGHFVKFFS